MTLINFPNFAKMNLLELQDRIIENKDWATILFILCLALIVIAKTRFESRFNDFIKLFFSDKYTRIYKETNHLYSGFNVIMLIVNVITLSFFTILLLNHINKGDIHDWILFIQIVTFVTIFIISKFLIEKIIAVIFNIEEIIEQFNLQKLNYRTYFTLLFFPIVLTLYFNNISKNNLLIWLMYSLLLINVLIYVVSLKNYQKFIFGKLFYFILYLCALEIAPYYFMYYLISKN
jgi:hypothetical protein